MTTIWKFTLKVADSQTIDMPMGAKILHVNTQAGDVCVWAEVDPLEKTKEHRHFEIRGTGHPIAPIIKKQYIGTVLFDRLVFHVFERLF